MKEMDEFKATIAELRSEDGCPWDRKQTFASLKKCVVEEAAEVIGGADALEQTGNPENLKEELGDLLMQVVMESQIAQEKGLFTLEDVIQGINAKMIYRHPHVFAGETYAGEEELRGQWKKLKEAEHAGTEWTAPYTASGFAQARALLASAENRKGFSHIAAEKWIERLNMQKHPEGGWFTEVYTASEDFGTVGTHRNCGGSIYFLLEGNDVSHFHVIDCDELWYHHDGCGVNVYFLDEEGNLTVHPMGIGEGMEPMVYVPAGVMFAAESIEPNGFTLMSCATLPAFTYEGFRLVPQEELLEKFPQHAEVIRKLAFPQADLPEM